jgi:hypothetical protein
MQVQAGEHTPTTAESRDAMSGMAEMCRTMMERSMAAMPYMMVAGAIFAGLIATALVLFVVLEIQWVRHWALRNKREAETRR